jgi:hypothetical protein
MGVCCSVPGSTHNREARRRRGPGAAAQAQARRSRDAGEGRARHGATQAPGDGSGGGGPALDPLEGPVRQLELLQLELLAHAPGLLAFGAAAAAVAKRTGADAAA